MKTNVLEVVIGAVVLVLASFFLYFAYVTSGEKIKDGYTLVAKFDDVSGLTEGADVKINGIKVGIVKKLGLDVEDNYSARAELTIKNEYPIPDDSSLAISTDGIMGNKFISVSTGYSDKYFESNAEVEDTKSSLNLEKIVGKVIDGFLSKPSDNKKQEEIINSNKKVEETNANKVSNNNNKSSKKALSNNNDNENSVKTEKINNDNKEKDNDEDETDTNSDDEEE